MSIAVGLLLVLPLQLKQNGRPGQRLSEKIADRISNGSAA